MAYHHSDIAKLAGDGGFGRVFDSMFMEALWRLLGHIRVAGIRREAGAARASSFQNPLRDQRAPVPQLRLRLSL